MFSLILLGRKTHQQKPIWSSFKKINLNSLSFKHQKRMSKVHNYKKTILTDIGSGVTDVTKHMASNQGVESEISRDSQNTLERIIGK